jgi:para-nitrobenzyl esterase
MYRTLTRPLLTMSFRSTARVMLACVVAIPLLAQRRIVIARFDDEPFQGRALSDDVASYRGVPYAAPPVGSLRWRAPQRRVVGQKVRDAAAFGPACPQTSALTGFYRNIAAGFGRADSVRMPVLRTNEDCLTLNIWTANAGARAPLRPVMVWIHGGSNINGEGSTPLYDGSNLAKRGVVVVTINYRLGALGFLAHPALTAESPAHSSGNYALLDQIAALQWVQRNIAAVGGDPTRVTLFGESAGAIDIMHLMASPLARGLFHRAIAESGAPMSALVPLEQAHRGGVEFARALQIDSAADVLSALRAKPAEAITAATASLLASQPSIAAPIVDGHVLLESTGKAFDQGRLAPVPLLLGTNALEMSSLRSYVPTIPRTVSSYGAWLTRSFSLAGPRIQSLYPAADDASVDNALLRVTTDLYMTCPARFAARAASKAGQPTFLYQFTRVMPGGESLGAYHAAEIGYVFGNRESWLPVQPEDEALSERMMQYWTQFAATGNPNRPGLPEWPQHDATADRYLDLGTDVTAKSALQRDACDLVQNVLRAQLK